MDEQNTVKHLKRGGGHGSAFSGVALILFSLCMHSGKQPAKLQPTAMGLVAVGSVGHDESKT